MDARVVIDRNRITGGGVTAGIDFGLALTALIVGEDQAKLVQLLLEYNPQPLFDAGSPSTAGSNTLKNAMQLTQSQFDMRHHIIKDIVRQPGE